MDRIFSHFAIILVTSGTQNVVNEIIESETEILYCLVLESGPRFPIGTIQAEITKKIEFSQKNTKLKMKEICLFGKQPTYIL